MTRPAGRVLPANSPVNYALKGPKDVSQVLVYLACVNVRNGAIRPLYRGIGTNSLETGFGATCNLYGGAEPPLLRMPYLPCKPFLRNGLYTLDAVWCLA